MAPFPVLLFSIMMQVPQPGALSHTVEQQRAEQIQDAGRTPSVRLAQMTIEQRIIIRVPMAHRAMPALDREQHADREERPAPPLEQWVEHRGPKCVKIKQVKAAAVTSPRGVDLMLRGKERVRARLGRGCRAIDLYSGFYIQPNEDGALCAGRDSLLARSGADCRITDILRLVPEP